MQLRSIAKAKRRKAGSRLGRMKSGLCFMNSHFSALTGMPGAAHGEA